MQIFQFFTKKSLGMVNHPQILILELYLPVLSPLYNMLRTDSSTQYVGGILIENNPWFLTDLSHSVK